MDTVCVPYHTGTYRYPVRPTVPRSNQFFFLFQQRCSAYYWPAIIRKPPVCDGICIHTCRYAMCGMGVRGAWTIPVCRLGGRTIVGTNECVHRYCLLYMLSEAVTDFTLQFFFEWTVGMNPSKNRPSCTIRIADDDEATGAKRQVLLALYPSVFLSIVPVLLERRSEQGGIYMYVPYIRGRLFLQRPLRAHARISRLNGRVVDMTAILHMFVASFFHRSTVLL